LPVFISPARFLRRSRSRSSSFAIVWPLQRTLETRVPRLLALVATLVVTLLVIAVLGYLIVWSFGTVGRWVIDNALRFQALYL
jgi:AI-2 transport protein TqsA